MKIYEKDVVQEIIKYLKSTGIKDIATEVGMFGESFIDVVYIDSSRNMVCVEVKLTDWRTVVKQALKLKKYTHNVYVIMPVPETRYRLNMITQEVNKNGLGLAWFKDKKIHIVNEPRKHGHLSSKGFQAQCFVSYLANNFYANLHISFLTRCIDYKSNSGHLY